MPSAREPHSVTKIIARDDVQKLFGALVSRQYDIIGPTIKDDAIVCTSIGGVDDLPVGWIDRQQPGSYHLARNKKKTVFAYTVGPHSWKRFLYPPQSKLMDIRRDGKKVSIQPAVEKPPKQAFVGVRSCELHAIAIQDKILMNGPYANTQYVQRRKNTLIVAVNCTRAGGTCFCVSMNTGPRASSGYDLALTEVIDTDAHYFVIETGTKKGEEILADLPAREAKATEIEAADAAIKHAASRMGRNLDTDGLSELLQRNFENPRWEKVGRRCLSCGNCTLVCPTCFCATIEDHTDLSGNHIERWRKWDSCFTADFSYIYGGSVRTSVMSRYRQWMMHKLAWWPEQFGTFGCVGCGRCLTWCPVGIDITEEAQAIRKSE